MREREHWAKSHPPSCTCHICVSARKMGMRRDQYLRHIENERKRAAEFTGDSAMSEALEILNNSRDRSSLEERTQEISERSNSREPNVTDKTSNPAADTSAAQHEIIKSQGRPFHSNFREKPTFWKRIFGG